MSEVRKAAHCGSDPREQRHDVRRETERCYRVPRHGLCRRHRARHDLAASTARIAGSSPIELRRPLAIPELCISRTSKPLSRSAENAARSYTKLLGFVVGVTTLEVRLLEENSDPERREKVRQIMTGLPAERYPTLVEHTAALRQTVGGDTQFEFGLDLMIAGMEQRLILSP